MDISVYERMLPTMPPARTTPILRQQEDGTASGNRYAFVQVMNEQVQFSHPYQASLFAAYQRLNETGALKHADHVLMQCGHARTHPGIKVVRFNCAEIDQAVGYATMDQAQSS